MKKFGYVLVLFLLFFGFQSCVYADSMSIWANVSSAKVGQTVTISVRVGGAGKFKVTSSNSSVLSGGTSGQWLEGNTYTFNFTAKSVGTATVTVTAIDAADSDSNDISGSSKSVSLNVIANTSGGSSSGGTTSSKKEYSSDNTLASLSVEGYDITPNFSKDTTEYTLEVDESVEKITISATSNDSKATVKGTGKVNLSNGENNIEVKVIAENGNEKVYKITVTVIDKNPITVDINNKQYTIVKKNNNVIYKLDGYEEGTIKIDDQDVTCYTNSNNNLTLIILKDEEGNLAYYVYDQGNYILYEESTFSGIKLYLLDMPKDKIPLGYSKYSFTYNEKEYIGYKLNKNSDYYLIYAMDINTGKKGLYMYDNKTNLVSRYNEELVEYYLSKEDKSIKKYQTIILSIVGIEVLGIIIAIIVSLFKGKKSKRKVKRK